MTSRDQLMLIPWFLWDPRSSKVPPVRFLRRSQEELELLKDGGATRYVDRGTKKGRTPKEGLRAQEYHRFRQQKHGGV